jgi:hypothetical protein
MATLTDPTATATENEALHRFPTDEPIDVRYGSYRDVNELTRLCRRSWALSQDESTFTLVACLADEEPLRLDQLLGGDFAADRLVITSVTAAAVQRLPLTPGDLRAEAVRRGMQSIVVESDAAQAVIGSMQILKSGDLYVVLVPVGVSLQQALAWLTQGSRWRGSLEAPDEGCFHYLPQ